MTRFKTWRQMLDYMKATVSQEDSERCLLEDEEFRLLVQMTFQECADFGYNFIGDMKDRIFDGAYTSVTMAFQMGLARGVELERANRNANMWAATDEQREREAIADMIEAFRRLVSAAA